MQFCILQAQATVFLIEHYFELIDQVMQDSNTIATILPVLPVYFNGAVLEHEPTWVFD